MILNHKTQLLMTLQKMQQNYDSEVQLLRSQVGTLGYHTTLKSGVPVHLTRESLSFALMLLDSELPEHEPTAFAVIRKVLALQDTDKGHGTFGIWPWYFEEPLAKMAPPDWNWADFCGHRLLLTAIRHNERLPEELKEAIKQSIFYACDAIIKRNVGPGYTNIAILGACVTLLAGEHFGQPDYLDYGIKRLQRFYEHTKRLGTFEEFNSPTYTVTAITDLSSIRTYTTNDTARALSAELLDIAWKLVAEHFHPVSKQWAGPHARSYSTLLRRGTLSFLQLAVSNEVNLISEQEFEYSPDWYKNEIQCPAHLKSFFVEKTERRLHQVVELDDTKGITKEATAYMNADCAVGSFSHEVMWNQRRNLVAYLDNQGAPAYLHLRFLRNGYDYSSAVFSSIQDRLAVLFGINFSTNGGNTHISLDRIDGAVDAEDLRVRFEIGGCLDQVQVQQIDPNSHSGYLLHVNNHVITLQNHLAAFDFGEPFWEIEQTEQQIHLDFVLYKGGQKLFNFRDMKQAVMIFTCSLSEEVEMRPVKVELTPDHVTAWFEEGQPSTALSLLTKPATTDELFKGVF